MTYTKNTGRSYTQNVVNENNYAERVLVSSYSRIEKEALNKSTFRAPLRSGFTLIELLVVVLIIGILAAVAVPQYQKTVDKVKYSQMVWNIKKIYSALEQYKLASGEYPPANLENLSDPSVLSSVLDIDIPPLPPKWYLYYRPANRYVGYYNYGTTIWLQCDLSPTQSCQCKVPSMSVTAKKVALCQALCNNPSAYSGSGEYACSL